MFAKSKISQSMIDAVNKVLGEEPVEQKDQLLNETAPLKEPTSTGMRVYGGSYGNSAKAKKDQTKSPVDNLKGPKDKEMKEELKGNQDKIDANHNGKIDGQDFKILRGKKKVKEGREFTEKLLETVRKSDVPAYLRKAKGDTPLTMADVKAPKKDTISAPENLAKARNEEVEQMNEDNLSDIAKKHGMEFNRTTYGAGMKHPKHGEISINRYGEWHHTGTKAQGDSTNKFASLDKHLSTLKEEQIQERDEGKPGKMFAKIAAKASKEYGSKEAGNRVAGAIRKKVLAKEDVTEQELDEALNEVLSKDASVGDWIHDFVHSDNPKFAGKSKAERKKMALGAYYGKQNEEADATTDRLEGRKDGGDENTFTHFKKKIKGDVQPDPKEDNDPEETSARVSIKAKPTDNLTLQKVKNQDPKYGTGKSFQEATIAGSPGWKEMKKDVKDKSGAVHTPMSRAKDLARQAFKKVSDKTKVTEGKKKW